MLRSDETGSIEVSRAVPVPGIGPQQSGFKNGAGSAREISCMNCPACRGEIGEVLKTEDQGDSIRRRRRCPCGYRWTTREFLVEGTGGFENTAPGGTSLSEGGVSASTRFDVMQRDGFKCVYCGARASDGKLTVDHVVPVSADISPGEDRVAVMRSRNEKSNLVTACLRCNNGKRDKPLPTGAPLPAGGVGGGVSGRSGSDPNPDVVVNPIRARAHVAVRGPDLAAGTDRKIAALRRVVHATPEQLKELRKQRSCVTK